MSTSFDYIIAGSGLAGLSLLHRLAQDEQFAEMKILVIDGEKKTKNDRTWCYWEKGEGIFEPIVHHSWSTLSFLTPEFTRTFQLESYQYKMILGDEFYRFVLEGVKGKNNISFYTGEIQKIYSEANSGVVQTASETFRATYVFNSTNLFYPKITTQNSLLQHFLGWKIKVNQPTFNPSEATLMDFTLDQKHGTTFMYMLPTTSQEALVEYTLFSPEVLEREEYIAALKRYIAEDLGIAEYEITHEEFGIIPMSLARFDRSIGGEKRIINIGTAGGFTKASTGYTFYFVQKHLDQLIVSLKAGKSPALKKTFREKTLDWYDRTLLDVLLTKKAEGRDVFAQLFKNVPPESVLAFLANESTAWEEFRIRHSVPLGPFISSGMNQLF
ncbi:lycopene cyclase family protein [Algoriphagus sp.]|uniref:lycopene cyclase family protein n=1 Tax=Algoriphagus sp. TaxID=1872435 RepID=UPI0032805E8D